MVKSCIKKGKKNLRVRFNKTVKDNEGLKKKIKRVNITRFAYKVLKQPLLEITPEFMLDLLEKNKQTSSINRARAEVINALDKLEDRVLIPKGIITAIGSKYVKSCYRKKIIYWSTKLALAAQVLNDTK